MPLTALEEPLLCAFPMRGSAGLLNQDEFVSDPSCLGQEARALGRAKVVIEGAGEDPLEGVLGERQG
jgi:hypothetical protein